MRNKRSAMRAVWACALALALVATMALGACAGPSSGGGGGSSSGKNSTLTIGLAQLTKNIDAIYAYDFSTNPVTNQVFESLLQFDGSDQVQPMLAKSWKAVDDKTYVYEIRDNVKFSDGKPMTMDDVMYSLERYKNKDLGAYTAWMYDNVASIEKTGDWEITVKLTQPDALWKMTFATTAGCIQEKTVVDAGGKDYGTVNSWPVGTGPYKITSWAAGGDIKLVYNTDYWNKAEAGEPDVKTVVFRPIEEDSTRVAALTSGQIDLELQTPVDMLPQIEKSKNAKIAEIPSAGLEYISFNTKKAPFDDVNARRAVASAINVEALQQNVIKSFGVPTNYLMVPKSLFTFEKSTWEAYEKSAKVNKYDVEQSKKYLAASKTPGGFSFDLVVDSKSIDNSVALAVQQDLKAAGITCNIKKVSNDEATSEQFGSGLQNGVRPYQALITEWSSDFPDPSGVLTPLVDSGSGGDGGSNSAQYANTALDALLKQQAGSSDEVERTKLLTQALDIINDEQPYYIYTHQNWLFAYNPRITKGVTDATPFWFWNMRVQNFKLSK